MWDPPPGFEDLVVDEKPLAAVVASTVAARIAKMMKKKGWGRARKSNFHCA